jgi:FtsP/CotA-like multicopper oxidase with cupredoxin domain
MRSDGMRVLAEKLGIIYQRKNTLIFIAITTLAFLSCGGDRAGDELQETGNPYNILNISPKTEYTINIIDSKEDLLRNAKTATFQYETGLPGGMIIVPKEELLKFHASNSIAQKTSIYWHGLRVPHDQNTKDLNSGASAEFEFTLDMTGTYWYHTLTRPIMDQLNYGLYAPFIVKEDYDSKYAGDYVLTLDDWTIDPITGNIDFDIGGSHGFSEAVGHLETVNRRTGNNIYPVNLKKGEIVKLRFINASTAQSHTMSMDEHSFRVTHLDGHKLVEPYMTNRFKIAPGERVDVELKGIKSEGTYYIKNERGYGMRIPVVYQGDGKDMESPFVPGSSEAFPGISAGMSPDKEYILDSTVERSGDGSHGSHESEEKPTVYTFNGKGYVDGDMSSIDIFECDVGNVYILRFTNNDFGMVDHISRHPIHLHGGQFQVISINGQPPERETWKDTIVISPREYVDVAVKFQYPGYWMLYCHIIDHEDNGMLTMIYVK